MRVYGIVLLIAVLSWVAFLTRYLEGRHREEARLSAILKDSNHPQAYQDKFFLISGPGGKVVGWLETLYVASETDAFHLDFMIRVGLGAIRESIRGTLVLEADGKQRLVRGFLTVRPGVEEGGNQMLRLQCQRVGERGTLLIIWNDQVWDQDFNWRFSLPLINPVFPFSRHLEAMGRSTLQIPQRVPLNLPPWDAPTLLRIQPTENSSRVDGIHAREYAVNTRHVEYFRFHLSGEGEVMSLTLPGILNLAQSRRIIPDNLSALAMEPIIQKFTKTGLPAMGPGGGLPWGALLSGAFPSVEKE